MAGLLNLFPSRVAIGKTADGAPVYLSPEFSRALEGLLERVGGPIGPGTMELAVEGAQADPTAWLAQLAAQVREIDPPAVVPVLVPDPVPPDVERLQAEVAELRKLVCALLEGAPAVPPTDWEHPGALGARTPNSGKFTTLTATAGVTLAPSTLGNIDNVDIGGVTPRVGAFTSLSATSDLALGVVANNGATLSPTAYHRGYSTVAQYRYLTNHAGSGWLGWGSDGVGALILGQASGANGAVTATWLKLSGSGAAITAGFGCNGKAAQAPAASGGTLAGVISALVANGILSS